MGSYRTVFIDQDATGIELILEAWSNAALKNVLIDLDHTLCSTEQGVEAALKHFAIRHKVENRIYLKKQFRKINDDLFKKYLNGQFTISEYRKRRYEQLLSLSGIIITSGNSLEEEADAFTNIMNQKCVMFEDAVDFLNYLQSKDVKIGLLTNGPADGQRTKLESLGISDYFDEIFISGETGYSKPDTLAFKNALNSLQACYSNTVMIGNSMAHDIVPALRLGMKTILLDRSGKQSRNAPSIKIVSSLKTLQAEEFILSLWSETN